VRSYEGRALDGGYQHISESPVWGDGETVDVPGDDHAGEDVTENIPSPDDDPEPDSDGQTTIDDFGWSP